jgi:hypothetical protein
MAPPKRPWFRFYVEAASDRKLRRLTPGERWLWVMVLAAARQSPVPGVLLITETEPMTVDELADFAGMKEREVKAGLEKMGEDRLGLIYERSDGAIVVTKWDVRQPESDDVTARTRRHRAKSKPPDDDPPPMERSIHVPGNGDRPFHERSRDRSKNVDGTHQKEEGRKQIPKSPLKEPGQTRARGSGGTPEIELDDRSADPDAKVLRAITSATEAEVETAVDRGDCKSRTGLTNHVRQRLIDEHYVDLLALSRQGWTARDLWSRIENPAHRPRPRAVGGDAA